MIENIDIGGVSLLRAAAKNYSGCCPVCDQGDYGGILAELKDKGRISVEKAKEMAVKAFANTANYDCAIADKLSGGEYFSLCEPKVLRLRYGENPHQTAALYSKEKLPFKKL